MVSKFNDITHCETASCSRIGVLSPELAKAVGLIGIEVKMTFTSFRLTCEMLEQAGYCLGAGVVVAFKLLGAEI